VKLTAATLNGQSAEAFDGSPEVEGTLEVYVRYVLSKDEKLLIVADTKEDPEGGQKAKAAKFVWTTLPDGCGKGAKVKLTGIQFVKKVGRDYNGKTYYDMVYSFAVCEVLEAGAARSGGFGGGGGKGWQPRSPEERASIEAQATMHAAADVVAAYFDGGYAKAGRRDPEVLGMFDVTFDHLWTKLQATKRAAAAAAPAQPSTQQGQPAANGAPGEPTTAKAAKTAPAQPQRDGDDTYDVTASVAMDDESWTGFIKLVKEASGARTGEIAVATIEKTAAALFGAAYKPLKAKFLTEDAMNAILKALREQ